MLLLTPFFAGCEAWLSDRAIPLAPGLIITESVTIEPGTYFLSGDSLGAIQIQGNGITVDFNGAVLDGAVAGQDPDTFAGVGLRISDSQSVTIKNAVIKGFKVAVMVTDVADFHLTKSDLSYNWRQRLKSTIERESQDDWMSYHHNENDEWLRYGAAVYLRRADRAKIDHIKVTGGQNGIMATEVNDALFYNNSITFNSSVGIGLYRSSRNQILHNRLDFNVRGHSPGVYNRGQDSAALLLYEQSNENVIAYNSATHSGDGLFLWAGQSTMDTGEGGCNDNLIYGNDFSFAPTNGIEVTFSRNQIINNRIEGCWHGIWGGYSFDTLVEGNEFINNEEHIAVEHGQRLAREDERRRPRALDRQPPAGGRLVRVGRPQHGQSRYRAQRGQVLDRLVRRAVLAEADRVVGEDEDDVRLLERRQSQRGTHVVGEDEEGGGIRVDAAVERHPVHDPAHGMLAHAEVHVVSRPAVERLIAGAGQQGVGRRRQIGRAADERREAVDQSVQHLARGLACGHRAVCGGEARDGVVPARRQRSACWGIV
ncbi:MAG: right-handed parallel beta-helix repeat-containing protein [Chloroflexi bacterium]|nr:right-handed parallel beta-helix repeat-containing protein [Chloroflexota bacterium]